MSTGDEASHAPVSAAERMVLARYGSQRVAIGTTMFTWINLSLLLAFGWPVLVVAFDAPAVGPEILPLDWYLLRLSIALTALGLVFLFWRQSLASLDSARPLNAVKLFRRSVLWNQGMLVLTGVSVILVGMLLIANPGQATKLILYGTVEVLAIQALFAGYVKTMLETLLGRSQSTWIVTGLFAVFFGLQSLAIAVTAIDSDHNYYLALTAGVTLGLAVGGVTLLLRDRSGSIYPGFLMQLVIFYLALPFLN